MAQAQEKIQEEKEVALHILVILFLIASGVLIAYGVDKLWIEPWLTRKRLTSPDVTVLNGAPLARMLEKSDKYANFRTHQKVSRVRSVGRGVDRRHLDEPGDRGGGQNILPPHE